MPALYPTHYAKLKALFALFIFALVAGSCVWGGGGGLRGANQDDVVDVDFVGPLVFVDVSDWEITGGGGSTGGPESEHLVGPGLLRLADGTEIVVEANTPGGTFCTELLGEPVNGPECLIVGVFRPGTNVAAWFATAPGSIDHERELYSLGQVEDIHGRDAIFSFGSGSYLTLPISEDAVLLNCDESGDLASDPVDLPKAFQYFAAINSENMVVEIECNENY